MASTDSNQLQDEIRSLVHERNSLNNLIKRLKSQIDGNNDGILNGLLSTKASIDTSLEGKRKLTEDDPSTTDEVEKRPKVEEDNATVDRHKRMMKIGLWGHLQKAKDALAKEKNDQNVIKHIEKGKMIETKLEERQKEQLNNLTKDIEEKIKQHEEKLVQIESSLSEKQTLLMRLKLKQHYETMGNFIATTTQPTIFWVPRKFNENLESLRNSTREFINKKLEIIANTDYY
ncbi:conserved hypothetical protein [Theileria equi strain WA]|uniref:Pinin/SDK/MemA protein domain-containing protein n=1 Tax=Theileria equi strain WA TaxID=1537102 RepID=L1LGK2_THEEQ|nr:conserved hypothetical protein [Theileria equi strain WA]EKX74385.1 conserved hypothetical protein [Theileria equi strain WA]|eukprot:XP_004833837.1 conserved hypothetical protein [Theileria equi strain WA]